MNILKEGPRAATVPEDLLPEERQAAAIDGIKEILGCTEMNQAKIIDLLLGIITRMHETRPKYTLTVTQRDGQGRIKQALLEAVEK